jgi:CspA family cold shock protein
MAKGEQRGNREAKKPKKEKPKTIAAAASQKGAREGRGTVKWYNPEKGFGFITPDEGGKDLFVHRSVLERSGGRDLPEGLRGERP